MADNFNDFFYDHFIYTSSDEDYDDGTDILMEVSLLIHDHTKNQFPRLRGSIKGHATVLDHKDKPNMCKSSPTTSTLPSNYNLPIYSRYVSICQGRCSYVFYRD
jgi:hypothetical protein